jgi:hypothetical protein
MLSTSNSILHRVAPADLLLRLRRYVRSLVCQQKPPRTPPPSRQTSHIGSLYLTVRKSKDLHWKVTQIWTFFHLDSGGTQAGLTAPGVVHDEARRDLVAIRLSVTWDLSKVSWTSNTPKKQKRPPSNTYKEASICPYGFVHHQGLLMIPKHVPRSFMVACSSRTAEIAPVRVCGGYVQMVRQERWELRSHAGGGALLGLMHIVRPGCIFAANWMYG